VLSWHTGAILQGVVNVGAVDMTEHQSVGAPYGIQGFPTIKIFGSNKQKPQDYQGYFCFNGCCLNWHVFKCEPFSWLCFLRFLSEEVFTVIGAWCCTRWMLICCRTNSIRVAVIVIITKSVDLFVSGEM